MDELILKLLELKDKEERSKANNISNILKYERIKRGMTQKQFAEMLQISRGSLAHYESGRVPLPSTLKKISDRLKIDLAKALMEGDM